MKIETRVKKQQEFYRSRAAGLCRDLESLRIFGVRSPDYKDTISLIERDIEHRLCELLKLMNIEPHSDADIALREQWDQQSRQSFFDEISKYDVIELVETV